MQIQNFHKVSMLQIEFSSQVVLHLRYKTIDFQTGLDGFGLNIVCLGVKIWT